MPFIYVDMHLKLYLRCDLVLFYEVHTTSIASYPGSRFIKCVGEEESLVSTALRFKTDHRHSLDYGFYRTLSHHAQMDDIISCQISIKSYVVFNGDG